MAQLLPLRATCMRVSVIDEVVIDESSINVVYVYSSNAFSTETLDSDEYTL